MMTKSLRACGPRSFVATAVRSARERLDVLARESANVVATDVETAGMSGIQLCWSFARATTALARVSQLMTGGVERFANDAALRRGGGPRLWCHARRQFVRSSMSSSAPANCESMTSPSSV
jgi:hypothetical protein